MKIEVFRAELKDLDKLAVLFDGYRQFYRQHSDLDLAQAFLQERMEGNESVIFIAKDENQQYLGFTQLYPSFSSVSAQRVWILNDLYVDPQHRSLGVGHLLLDQAKSYAQQTGVKGITLETEKTNVGAQKLYESLNYEKDEDHFVYFLNTN